MIFYRLESNKEVSYVSSNVMAGPYCGGAGSIACVAVSNEDSGNNETHPNPTNDIGLCGWWETCDDTFKWVFGFSSLEQLNRWFYSSKRMRELHAQDIAQIGIYKVPDSRFKQGQFQAVARAEDCTLIETQPVWRET